MYWYIIAFCFSFNFFLDKSWTALLLFCFLYSIYSFFVVDFSFYLSYLTVLMF